MTRALMFQGTGSSVGKSTIVAGLARALTNRGLRVLPFKPQNMSNNAAVTPEGGEIGRAQALQARACRVAPSVHMNPILLKPQSETGSQIIVQGRVFGTAKARDYQALKPQLMPHVLESFAHLQSSADLILIEGAGSASEINLRANDIANMGFARATNSPVILIGDIDRGGVIASLVGTRTVLDPADAALIAGFIVNKMRGDPTLFADGMAAIARHTPWRPLGLVPHFDSIKNLPAEDAADLAANAPHRTGATLVIAVPMLPCIANFDDLDPLHGEPDVDLRFIPRGTPLPREADLIILPGSKATIADLATLRAEGWDIDIRAHHRHGGALLGLCGGYQMLGRSIADPHGIEGPPGSAPGLGLLDIETILAGDKRLTAATGRLVPESAGFTGFEMHIGQTTGPATARPLLHLADGRADGAQSPDGRIAGTYIHGIFTADPARAGLLRRYGATPARRNFEAEIDATLDALAAHLETHIDIDALLTLAR
ncbi:MAG: cobyric acid synthase CobQ [Acidiphilium sp. 37-64-53]|uniref:cobyric acid synthase n=1 Tax=Acidiphilium TaxID=522 RepID=UPI000BCCCF66|nr:MULTISPECIES: cobyric acid synthase [Acidiphilium]OYW02685.1 MAG: cobyric acid synthase CobQ [Acidiphilium sp. 37-64-53]OZB29972.1 MAG: cobyric acid synthase CobQ [Acidiphilium sp. 34-64-41]HQT85112.1 cobyric acid synthase [Acidiphilium rubrum]